jgi:hypothetical protein
MHQPYRSAVKEHSTESGHCIIIQDTKIVDKASRYTNLLVKEAVELRLHVNNVSMGEGFELSKL